MREQISTPKVELINSLLTDNARPNPFYDAVVKRIGDEEAIRVIKTVEVGKNYCFYIGDALLSDKQILQTRPLRLEKELVDKLEKELAIDVAEGETAPKFELDSTALYAETLKEYTRIKTSIAAGVIDEFDVAEFASISSTYPKRTFVIRVLEGHKLMNATKTRTIRLTTISEDVTALFAEPVVVTSLNHQLVREQILAALEAEVGEGKIFPEDISLPATHFVENNRYTMVLRPSTILHFGKVEFKVNLIPGEEGSIIP